jgi:hypothetical protein
MDLYIHSPIRLHVVVLNYFSTGTTFKEGWTEPHNGELFYFVLG